MSGSTDGGMDVQRLAEQVKAELTRSGIPAWISDEADDPAGALIDLDDASGSGGVAVRWEPVQLADEAADHLAAGEPDDPSISHLGVVCRSMREAIIQILSSAGYPAEKSSNDLDPYALLVRPKD